MIPTAEWRRQQAVAAAERFHRAHVQFPGCLTAGQARALGDADGPEPAPTKTVDDDITAACVRLFCTHKGE